MLHSVASRTGTQTLDGLCDWRYFTFIFNAEHACFAGFVVISRGEVSCVFFLFLCWFLFGFGCVIVMLLIHCIVGTCNLFDIIRHLFGKDHLTFELRVAKGQKKVFEQSESFRHSVSQSLLTIFITQALKTMAQSVHNPW